MNFELDNDGYPTEETLENIENYDGNYSDLPDLIGDLFSEFGKSELNGNEWTLVTGGWSGNENMINALINNHLFYHTCWYATFAGVKYIFKLKKGA
jgi:hypothetical protein